ncbi:unnamed protein product [Phytophthora lilii]|uniref:Unnamed protein product n=1 Tax=Phytophthora lilii TaxID=2077276 RepID=A0A9W6TK53_9STRA|nr:unnamed protein product [Phytophthora lilii]
MDGFESQMAAIRARLEGRRELASPEPKFHLPAVSSSTKAASIAAENLPSMDRLKLPLVRRINQTRAANAPPKDPFLEVENVIHRSISREIYVRDADAVAAKELSAVSVTKEAQELGEEARKRMVAYTQNESGWKFEERTTRYQQVMEIKRQAEKAQQDANMQRNTIRQIKELIRDPYGDLRASPLPRNALSPIASSPTTPLLARKLYEWVWILGSPSTKLSFTPRDETPRHVIDSEKELSMYVLYYIAASSINYKRVEGSEQWQDTLNNDCPPTSGWMCCSVHGAPPAPELVAIRSGLQTWTVTGAGTGHLNGKYVACGVHDHVKRFKSSAGVELFRKCVPVASSLSQILHGGETAGPESARPNTTDDDLNGKVEHVSSDKKKPNSSIILPSGLASVEKDELDFRPMQRVGTWLSMNESIEKNRRMLASRSANGQITELADAPGTIKLDGNSVMSQESRELVGSGDIAESRPEVNPPLCREWVFFARCTKRRTVTAVTGVSALMKGTGLECLKRHYYISHDEKREMTVWVQTKESWLEKNVLAVIIEREAQIDRVHRLSRKCMTNFQHNLQADTEKIKVKLLAELNRVRFLTVKVLEAIDRWRQHARKIGFARYDYPTKSAKGRAKLSNEVVPQQTEAPLLGWSSSITLDTGKYLHKGSKAFVSKVKRFRRSEDIAGKNEHHIVYLGYFATQEEAERAYDEHAASKARRLNTTVEHLPSRRNVFRSCGKHFAVESEKDGPSFCIECKTKQLASISLTSADEWVPPFFYGTGVNYIMKMANDLDFLDGVLPLKAALNNGRGVDGEAFPMRGNIFLLPKTPIQDPDLAVFTSFPTPSVPRLGVNSDSPGANDVDEETLDRERVLRAQQIFLQELQIYRPELISDSPYIGSTLAVSNNQEPSDLQYRLVEALYWDHCAALKIQQERPPLALRQQNVWCRPDVGEWASLVVRGAHQLHFLFEEKLEKAGKDMVQKRQQVLAALRQLNKAPLYFVPSRTNFIELITAGQQVRGDVVQLEVNNATKRLQRYDVWCIKALVVQRWFRGVLGRQKARARRKALRFAYKLRIIYAKQVATVAKIFYEMDVLAVALRRAYKIICSPAYSRSVMMDGELVIMTFHSLHHSQLYHGHYQNATIAKRSVMQSACCANCARRFSVKAQYQTYGNRFAVFRGVCTCSFNGDNARNNDESWLIRAYSPYHNVIYRLKLEAPRLQSLLASYQPELLLSTPHKLSLIMDMEMKQSVATNVSRYATFCLQNAEKAATNLANWRRMHSEATQTRKSLMVSLEKHLLLLTTTDSAHRVSVGNAKKALDFASRPFSQAQAWDPLENANDWRYIVEKRQLTKRLEEVHQEVERIRVAYFQATYNEQYTRAGANSAQNEYNQFWLPISERENKAMEAAILHETTARTRMENFMQQLCDRFLTLRDTYLLPTRRTLVIQSPVWHEMVPFRLDIPGLRRRLNHLRRRTLILSNIARQNSQKRRMIVTVSMWPLLASDNHATHGVRDLWVTGYDPVDCSVHNIFLEWELVQLLIGSHGKKIWQDRTKSKRSAWRSIADILLSLTMLDRFTGEFTLHKLQFYHTLRTLKPQFLSSRVMRDLQAGRKCGKGDEVLRQAVSIDGKLCVVVVYENWGDLTVAIYHTVSGDFFRVVMDLSKVFDLLSNKPLMLRLWICCVKSNSYSSTVLLYLLKHVRFYQCESGCEDVRIDTGLPAQKRCKRYQKVLTIQNRQVLTSIREDAAGDFQVSAYDVRNELTYNLQLEREYLHRILKNCPLPTESVSTGLSDATSSSSLLLRRNRKFLYEWICDRLHFQHMLEHPEAITSGTSPLRFGIHLRESFRILNWWIGSTPRNPLQIVSEAAITRRAIAIDTDAFSSLQFDQLTLISYPRLPFELRKEYAGTMDWIEAVAGPSTHNQEWKKRLPYMKMDFFVKAHTVFARLRGELEAEIVERRKRENWAGMEQEDFDGLCTRIMGYLASAKKYIMSKWQHLSALHMAATKWINQWQEIHVELRLTTKSREAALDSRFMVSSANSCAAMIQEDSDNQLLNYLNLWMPTTVTNLLEFISLAVPINSCCPVEFADILLRACLNRVDKKLVSRLDNLELTFEKIKRSGLCLEELQDYKQRVKQFLEFLEQIPSGVASVENGTTRQEDKATIDTADNHETCGPKAEEDLISAANTGILIPGNSDEPIQEVFLADMPSWIPSPVSSFVVHAQLILPHLRSFFQRQLSKQNPPGSRFGRRTSNANGQLICQRAPYGLLVHQINMHETYSKNQASHVNTRASGLARGTTIYGPALFWPFQDKSVWIQKIINCSAIYIGLVANSEEPKSDEVFLKRPAAARSTKYLPWKQFAIERLRITRAVKRSRMSENQCIATLADGIDQIEKEKRTIAMISVGFRQLEITLGMQEVNSLINSNRTIARMKHLFALSHERKIMEDSNTESGSMQWRVFISNPRILRHTFNMYDSDGRAIQIPCIGRDGNDEFTMEGIQVEIDDVDKPRRLIFSCRELQTQRRYHVDCDYDRFRCLLLQRTIHNDNIHMQVTSASKAEIKWKRQADTFTVGNWRSIAALISQFLVFRKKNGVLSLCLELYNPEIEPKANEESTALEGSNVVKASEADASDAKIQQASIEKNYDEKGSVQIDEVVSLADSSLQTVKIPHLPVQRRCHAEIMEGWKIVERSLLRHFQGHQTAIRAAASGRVLAGALPPNIGVRTQEWMEMTREDWSSQELRGMLVLDQSVLNKLEKAYTPATRRAREYLRSSIREDDTVGLELQVNEIGKAMGQTALRSDEVELLQSIRMTRWRRRGKEASAIAKKAEVHLADIAEWWRQRSKIMQSEN